MQTYYASLVKSLFGLYYPVRADSIEEARAKMATSDLKSHWCSVYTSEEVDRQITEFGHGAKLPEYLVEVLSYDHFELSKLRN